MNQAVYVRNIPWSVSQEELSEFMAQCGQVEHVSIPEYQGRSKGFGIVTYTTPEAATRAITELDGAVLKDRNINVRENQPRQHSSSIFVGNLSWDVNWQELKDHFRIVGEVVFADILKTYEGTSKGCGIIEFESPQQAQEAIVLLNNSDLKGRQISVREHQPNQRQQNNQGRNFNNQRTSRPYSNFNDQPRSYGEQQPRSYGEQQPRSYGEQQPRSYREQQPRSYNEQPRRKYSNNYNSDRQSNTQGEQVESNDLSRRVYVSNLPYRIQWQELKDYMRSSGNVTNVSIFKNQFDGRSKGCGIVEFQSADDAQLAIKNLNNTELQGRSISVQADRGQPKPRPNSNY